MPRKKNSSSPRSLPSRELMKLPILIFAATVTCIVSLYAAPDRLPLIDEVTLNANESFEKEIDTKGQRSPAGKVYLKFAARIDSRWKDGSQPGIDLFVNNIPMSGRRLVNKPRSFPFGEYDVVWYRGDARWTVPYYDWAIGRPPQPYIHLYVFDITSLLTEEKASIRITDIFNVFAEAKVILREVEVLFTDDFPRVEAASLHATAPLDALRDKASGHHLGTTVRLGAIDIYEPKISREISPRADFSQPYTITVGKEGDIALSIGGETYPISSQLGLPDSGWIDARKGKEWSEFSADQDSIILENARLSWKRTIHRHPSYVEIRDHLANLTDGDLPVGVLNALDVEDVRSLTEFRLSGKVLPSFWANTQPERGAILPMLPLAFVARKSSGVGLWLDDDAYRNQGSILAHDSKLYAGTDRFYLSPKGSYTFVWRLYPTDDRRYFTVINSRRHADAFYQEIPGILGFVYPDQRVDSGLTTPGNVKEFFNRTGIRIAGMLPTEEIRQKPKPYQYMVYGNEKLERIRKSSASPQRVMALSKEAKITDVNFIVYTDIHLMSNRGEENEWRETMKESIVLDEQGRLVPFSAGFLYCVVPIEGTPAAKRFEASVNWYLDEAGYNGIFFDEWPNSRANQSFAPGHEDGISAIIDGDFRIQRKYGIIPLLAKPFQGRLIRQIKEKHPDAILYANHLDATREATGWPIVHFSEPTQYDDDFLRAAQAYRTPLSLNTKFTDSLWRDATEFLRQGVLLTYYSKRFSGHHLLREIYPITVLENGPGYIIGHDKIVTQSSGTYHFRRSNGLTARIFGGEKAALLREQSEPAREGGITKITLELQDTEIAIITETPTPPATGTAQQPAPPHRM